MKTFKIGDIVKVDWPDHSYDGVTGEIKEIHGLEYCNWCGARNVQFHIVRFFNEWRSAAICKLVLVKSKDLTHMPDWF